MKMDKGGAATIAGFMMTLALTRPTHVRAVAHLAFVSPISSLVSPCSCITGLSHQQVRNSIGAECYVADEIVTARSGRRVLVVNTDAEGRMAMADILTKTKCVSQLLLICGSLVPSSFLQGRDPRVQAGYGDMPGLYRRNPDRTCRRVLRKLSCHSGQWPSEVSSQCRSKGWVSTPIT